MNVNGLTRRTVNGPLSVSSSNSNANTTTPTAHAATASAFGLTANYTLSASQSNANSHLRVDAPPTQSLRDQLVNMSLPHHSNNSSSSSGSSTHLNNIPLTTPLRETSSSSSSSSSFNSQFSTPLQPSSLSLSHRFTPSVSSSYFSTPSHSHRLHDGLQSFDPLSVTVFGFDGSFLSAVLNKFSSFGEIHHHETGRKANWMNITYKRKEAVDMALAQNGCVLKDMQGSRQVMIGVKLTTLKGKTDMDDAGQDNQTSLFRQTQTNTSSAAAAAMTATPSAAAGGGTQSQSQSQSHTLTSTPSAHGLYMTPRRSLFSSNSVHSTPSTPSANSLRTPSKRSWSELENIYLPQHRKATQKSFCTKLMEYLFNW